MRAATTYIRIASSQNMINKINQVGYDFDLILSTSLIWNMSSKYDFYVQFDCVHYESYILSFYFSFLFFYLRRFYNISCLCMPRMKLKCLTRV